MGALLVGIDTNSPESAECVQHGFRNNEDRNRIRLEAGAGSEASFKLAVKDKSRKESFRVSSNEALKKNYLWLQINENGPALIENSSNLAAVLKCSARHSRGYIFI
jgi:hypothetical protein